MVKKRINLSDFSKEIRNFQERSSEELKAAMKAGVLRSFRGLVESSPVDTGEYAASWDFSESERAVMLGNYAPHASIIEYGARPFTPPIGPLLAWAKRVLQDGSQAPNYSSEVWALAKGTQKKIAEKGMMPRHVLKKELPSIINNILKEVDRL